MDRTPGRKVSRISSAAAIVVSPGVRGRLSAGPWTKGLSRCVMAVVLLWSAVGCGNVYYTIEYDDATFAGSKSGTFDRMQTGEVDAASQIQHPVVVDLFVRLPDGAVFELAKFPEKEAVKRSSGPSMDLGGGLTSYFVTPMMSLYYRQNGLVGAILSGEIEFSTNKNGPFATMPMTSQQVRNLLGQPRREASRRGPMKWN